MSYDISFNSSDSFNYDAWPNTSDYDAVGVIKARDVYLKDKNFNNIIIQKYTTEEKNGQTTLMTFQIPKDTFHTHDFN